MSTTRALDSYPLFVDGEWLTTAREVMLRLPYDGSAVARVYEADAAMMDRAIGAATRAAPVMAGMSNYDRADLLWRLHAILEQQAEEFAHLISLETGKPITEARVEADRSTHTVAAAAHEAQRLSGEVVAMDAAPAGRGRMAMTVREPLGVIGAITPFNVPLNLALHKVAPALAAGNTVVHKPSAQTPLSALHLARALEKAGAPHGAYNVVTGDGAGLGRQLVSDPRVAMITFTGSVPVGKAIRAAAGLKKVTLELGGNSAMIVEPDGDLDTAVARAVPGSFAHSGQVCISVQRIFAHESIADRFVERFAAASRALRIGHPLDETTDHSSLISEEAAIRVSDWIDEAVAAGARVIAGGARRRATIPPTILEHVPSTARISCSEVFGPVVSVNRYRDLEDAISQVNDTPYGLQAGIFTRDLERAFRAARRIRVGGVLINDIPTFRVDHMPYGGVKESGLGREGPRYAIEEMTDLKLVCWKV